MKLKSIAKASLISLIVLGAVRSAQAYEFVDIMSSYDKRALTPEYLALPESASIHARLGEDKIKFNRPEAAISYFTQAIKLNPSFARINSQPGKYFLAYGRNGQNSKIMQRLLSGYNEVLRKTPTDPYALAVRGEIKFALEDAAGAEADFKKSVAYKNDLLFSNLRLVEVGLFLRPSANTLCYSQQALARFPKNARMHCNSGLAYEELGDHTRAIAAYDKAIELDPKFSRAYLNRAVAYSKSNNFTAEFSDIDHCLVLEPDLAIAHSFSHHEHARFNQFMAAFFEEYQRCDSPSNCAHDQPLPQKHKYWPLTIFLSLPVLLAALVPRLLRRNLLFHE